MLEVAARLSPTIRWQQGSAQELPFSPESFEAVVSQFGLMFFPDPVEALREMMRVLVPGGRLAVAVWASLADTPAYAAETELVERLAGPSTVEVDLRGWLPIMGIVLDEELIAEILWQAEAALRPYVSRENGGVAFDSPAVLATATKS